MDFLEMFNLKLEAFICCTTPDKFHVIVQMLKFKQHASYTLKKESKYFINTVILFCLSLAAATTTTTKNNVGKLLCENKTVVWVSSPTIRQPVYILLSF